ncbi:MAG: hypothetical protein IJW63_07090 [Lachnospiraceae bacterium]|nr:hypothetical protein [Lachnospiraceae bacterium]
MKKKLLNNWLLKILSLAIAFMLWFIVINVENPVDEKSFSNIKVNFINTDILDEENKVYQVLESTDVVRTVRVEAPRKVLDELTSSDIVAEADFADVTINDTVEIKFYSIKSNSEIRAISGNIDMVRLNIEDKKTKRLVLSVETSGEPEEGYVIGTPVLDQNRIEVSGPESIISRIYAAKMKVDVSDSSSEISTYATVKLYDTAGNEISKENLTMNTQTVKVKVPVLATKEVKLVFEYTGQPAEGYAATGKIEPEESKLIIAGTPIAIASVSRILIPASELDLTGRTTDLTKIVNVRDYLPEGVTFTNGFNGKVTVTVDVEPLQEKEFTIKASQISAVGIPEGFFVTLPNAQTEYKVRLRGLQDELDEVDATLIQGYVQIDNMLESLDVQEVVPGVYQATVDLDFADSVSQVAELQIEIILGKEEIN